MPNCRGRGNLDGNDLGDAPGARRQHDHTIRKHHRFRDRMGDERTVFGCSRQMRISSRVSSSRVSASSAPKGSSMSRMSGSCTSARQMPARICMPPDSSRGYFALEAVEADELQQALARALGLSGVTRFIILSGKEHVVEHVRPGQ